jgi:transposase InsO family protein
MDFKGHFPLTDPCAGRCYPLTVLDDHSRYAVCLTACSGETGIQVQTALTQTFRRYGLPARITCDNGNPWGTPNQDGLTRIEAWLIRLGIRVGHSRPFHPQTQGKDERFHRTLKRELLNRTGFNSLDACQRPPAVRYTASARPFPAELAPVEYDSGDDVRKVRRSGQVQYKGRAFYVGEGLIGELVALRPTEEDGVFKVLFCDREVRRIDLRSAQVE